MTNIDDLFNKKIHEDDFSIKIENPEFIDEDDKSVKALVVCDIKESDRDAYYSSIKFTGRSIKKFAKECCVAQAISNEEVKEQYIEDIYSVLLSAKSELAELAEEKQEHEENANDLSTSDTDEEPLIHTVLKRVYRSDDPTIEDMDDIYKFNDLQQNNQDLVLRIGKRLELTKKGERKAEELLDITRIEDVEKEAEQNLEDKPLKYILDAIKKVHIGDEELLIWELISALSAKISETQINSWAVGPSGKGKSHIKRRIIDFIPEEAYESPNSMSPKAMLYKTKKEGTDFFKGKLLFLDEAEGYDQEFAKVLLRGLTDPDEDTFTHEMVQEQEHKELIIEKPLTVWFTSVESINDEQLKNRFILTNPDGSESQDEDVFQHQQANLHRGRALDVPPAEAKVVKTMLKDVRQNTAGLTPIIPFKVEWKQKFNRRLYPYFVTLMEIIAKLNYKNRVVKERYIYVTMKDFQLASTIWSALIDTTITQTDTEALKLILTLPERESEAATTSELATILSNFNTSKVRRKAKQLQQTEELSLINSKKKGGKWKYWAGDDKELLVDPAPNINASDEIMEDILEDTEYGVIDKVKENVRTANIPVYKELKEKQEEEKKQKMEEANHWSVELTTEERDVLEFLKSMDWGITADSAISMMGVDKNKGWENLENLEEKGLISVEYEDGSDKQVINRTTKYKRAKEQGKLRM